MILTNKFEILKREYFHIILKRHLQKQWHVLVLLWLLAIFLFLDDEKEFFHFFIIGFAILYPIIVLFTYWKFMNAKENKIIFIEREHEIYDDKLVSRMSNGSESSINIDTFVNAIEINNVYLVYINKTNSIFFPKRCFKTPEDEAWFKNNFFVKIKSKATSLNRR